MVTDWLWRHLSTPIVATGWTQGLRTPSSIAGEKQFKNKHKGLPVDYLHKAPSKLAHSIGECILHQCWTFSAVSLRSLDVDCLTGRSPEPFNWGDSGDAQTLISSISLKSFSILLFSVTSSCFARLESFWRWGERDRVYSSCLKHLLSVMASS